MLSVKIAAYNGTARFLKFLFTIDDATVKGSQILCTRVCIHNTLFSSQLRNWPNKLECLSPGMSNPNKWNDRRKGNSHTAKIPLKPYH